MRFATLTLIASLLGCPLFATAAAPETVAVPAGKSFWDSRFPDMNGKEQALAQWRGKPLIVNYWATWCAPCREEMPEFISTQKKYSKRLRFVGIAIDNPEDVAKFVKQYGVNYPVLIGDNRAMELMRSEGNRIGGLPFTVIYDAAGNKVAVEAGRLRQDKLNAYLDGLLIQR